MKCGVMIFETRAALEGLFSKDTTFLATPKSKSANKVHHSWVDLALGWSGIVLALYRLSIFYFIELSREDFLG